MELEQRGVATITLCTTHFAGLAAAVMRGANMPRLAELGMVILPHPLAELRPDAVIARAEEALPQVERLLQLRAPTPAA